MKNPSGFSVFLMSDIQLTEHLRKLSRHKSAEAEEVGEASVGNEIGNGVDGDIFIADMRGEFFSVASVYVIFFQKIDIVCISRQGEKLFHRERDYSNELKPEASEDSMWMAAKSSAWQPTRKAITSSQSPKTAMARSRSLTTTA